MACASATGRTTRSSAAWAATSRRTSTIRPRGRSSIPGPSSASTAFATSRPAARRPAFSANRDPFALPRVNVAWDIDGEGNNVLRGGYGIFYNRNMGNVEYDNSLRLAPNSYQVATDFWAGGNYGNGLGLTYDTISEATLANRIGSLGLNSLTPDSFTFPKTHSFSLSYAKRIPWNQVAEVSYVGTRGQQSGQPQQRQRHALRGPQHRHLQRHRPVEPGEPVCGRHRGHQPVAVPPVQRAERDDPLRFPRQFGIQLDAGHAEPADRAAAAVLRGLYPRTLRGHARRRVLAHRPLRSGSHQGRAGRGPDAHPERVVECLPARRSARRDEQHGRPRAAERMAVVRHLIAGERHSLATELHRRRRRRPHFGNLLRHGRRGRAEQQRRQRPRAVLHLQSAR